MTRRIAEAIAALIDAKIAYALASAETNGGDRGACVEERRAVDAAEKELRDALYNMR